MSIVIRYCVPWNYKPRAARLADLIKAQHSLDVELVPGKRGELSVWVDGMMVAEKNASGWPDEGTVLTRVAQAIRTA